MIRTKYLVILFTILFYSCGSDSSDTPEEVPLSADNFITSFRVNKSGFSLDATINGNSITGSVPSSTGLTEISLDVEISQGATIAPNPNTVTSLEETVVFTVEAENGTTRQYNVNISRELSNENNLESFKITSGPTEIFAEIDANNLVSKRLPDFIDRSNLTYEIEVSDFATIEPNPNEVTDFSSEVVFTITSESGQTREYTIMLESMDTDFETRCDSFNVSKWFGGDARDDDILPFGPFDRNVGTGQALTLEVESNPTTFGVLFTDSFVFRESGERYNDDVELKLNIRDSDGNIMYTATTTVLASFIGGWVFFDLQELNVFLDAGTTYIFTWHLIDGGNLGITTGSYGNENESLTICNGKGYSGQSRVIFNQNLDDWNLWFEQDWFFNFSLSGKN